MGSDDGEELRPTQLHFRTGDRFWAHCDREPSGPCAEHVDGDLAGTPGGQRIKETGELGGDAGADKHVVDSREHGAVRRRRGGHLNLLQVVDPDQAFVALLGEEYLHEVGRDDEIGGLPARIQRQARHQAERLYGIDAAFDEVAAQDLLRGVGVREARQRPADVTSRVSQLETAGEEGVQRHSRDHTELARKRNCPYQGPPRDADTHAALDDRRPVARRPRAPQRSTSARAPCARHLTRSLR